MSLFSENALGISHKIMKIKYMIGTRTGFKFSQYHTLKVYYKSKCDEGKKFKLSVDEPDKIFRSIIIPSCINNISQILMALEIYK